MLAREQGITRGAQDAFAIQSHEKALAGRVRAGGGNHARLRRAKRSSRRTTDRATTRSLEVLGKLRPAFDKYGTVTPGNSSQITDGAVALLVGTEARAERTRAPAARVAHRLRLHRLRPRADGLGPVSAMEKLAATDRTHRARSGPGGDQRSLRRASAGGAQAPPRARPGRAAGEAQRQRRRDRARASGRRDRRAARPQQPQGAPAPRPAKPRSFRSASAAARAALSGWKEPMP